MGYLDRVNSLARKLDSNMFELILTVNTIDNKEWNKEYILRVLS